MAVVKNAIDLIGNTPVYRIPDTNVYVKLEKYNAGGSVKDRAVLGMLQDAKEKGLIKNDTIIVEATSGNTGIALAMLGAMLSIKTIIIMPECMSKERRELIKAYGAQLILTPKELGMKGALGKAQEILDNYPNAVTLGQFVNPANPPAHYGKRNFAGRTECRHFRSWYWYRWYFHWCYKSFERATSVH